LPFTIAVTSPAPSLLSTYTGSATVQVTYNGGYSGNVLVNAPTSLPAGVAGFNTSQITLTPSSTSATFTITGSSSNPSPGRNGSITFTATDSNGNNSTTASVGYTVIDPYALTVTPPSNATIDSTAVFTVAVNANSGFNGSVSFTSGTGTSCTPTTVSAGSSTACAVTFTNVTPAGLSASTSTNGGAFTLAVPTSAISLNTTPYTVAVTSGTANLLGGQPTTVTVQVTYNGTYNSSVTITAPSTLPTGITSITATSCAVSAQPTRMGRRVSSVRGASGTPASGVATPSSSSVCFAVVGADTNLSSGSFNFSSSDSFTPANTGSASASFSVMLPFTIAVTSAAPSLLSTYTGSATVQVTYNGGYTGNVLVNAPTSLPTGISGFNTPQITLTPSSTSATFTITGSSSNPSPGRNGSIAFTATDSNGNNSTQASVSYTVIDPYSLSVTPPSNATIDSVAPFTVAVNANGSFAGNVAFSAGTGTSCSPSTVSAGSSTVCSVTVTNVTPAGLSASSSTNSGAFTLAVPTSAISLNTTPYTVAVTSGTANLLGGQPTTVTVQVTYNGTYNSSVTITAPSTLPAGITSITATSCVTAAQPARMGRRVETVRGASGTAASGVATPSSSSVCFAVVGADTTSSSGSFSFSSSDGFTPANTGSASASYSVMPPFTIAVTSPALSLLSTYTGTATVQVTYNGGYTGNVLVNVPASLPTGISSFNTSQITLTPSSTSATFTITGSSSNPSPGRGGLITFTATDSNGNNSNTASVSYTVIDPYALSVTSPTNATIDSVAPFTVAVTANGSFSGNVAFTGGTGTSCSPTTVSAGSSTACSVTFTNVTPAGLSASTSTNSGAFTLAVPTSAISLNTTPYTVAVTSGTANLLGGQPTTVTVQVTYNGTYNSSVTITAPSTLPTGITSITATSCVSAQPTRMGRRVETMRGASGTATSGVATPSNSSVCFAVVGADTNLSSGSFNFSSSDSFTPANTGSASVSYSVMPPFTIAVTSAAPSLLSTYTASATVQVTYAGGYTGNVLVNAPTSLPTGISGFNTPQITLTPSSTSATFTITGSSSNPSPGRSGSITFTATDSNGNNSTTASVSYTVIDPYSLSVTPPSNATIDSVAPFTVAVNANGSFSGNVAFTGGTGTSCSPATVGAGSSTTCSVTFTNVTPAGLSASSSTNSGAFTLPVPTSAISLSTTPYTVAVTSGTANLLGGQPTTVTVQVTYNGTYNSSVTITAPSTLPTGITSITATSCVAAAQPTRMGRRVETMRGASGTAASGVATPSSSSVCFAVVGADANLSSGNFSFTASDNFTPANTGSASASYSVMPPFTIAVTSAAPSLFSTYTGSATVQVTYNGGYSGNVLVNAPTSLPTGISGFNTSQVTLSPSSTSATFTITGSSSNPSPGHSGSITFTATDSNGNNSTQASVNYTVIDPYSLSVTPPSNATIDSVAPFTVAVDANGSFAGNVAFTGGTGTSCSPTTVGAGSSTTCAVTFTNVTPAGLTASSSTNSGAFTLAVPTSAISLNTTPYTVAVTSGTASMAGDGSTTVTVQVTYNGTYNSSVTITAPSNLPTGISSITQTSCVSSAQPAAMRRVSSERNARGTGASGIATPSSSSVCFTLTASDVLVNSGSFSFSATDAFTPANTGSAAASYSITPPWSISATTPVTVFSGFSASVSITVNFSSGFVGSVAISAPNLGHGSGLTSLGNPNPATAVSNGSGNSVTVNFSLTADSNNPNPGRSGTLNFSAVDNYGMSISPIAQSYTAIDPYAISITAPNNPVASTTANTTVTVTPNSGWTGSAKVVLTASGGFNGFSNQPQRIGNLRSRRTADFNNGQTNYSQTVSVSGSTPVTFSVAVPGGSNQLTLDAAGTTGPFQANAHEVKVNVTPAFTVSVPHSTLNLFSDGSGSVTVTVTFNAPYSGSVTVYSPDPRQVNGVSGFSLISPSATLTSSGTVTFKVTASDNNPGPRGSNDTMTFTAQDNQNNSDQDTEPVATIDPFSISDALPNNPVAGTAASYSVIVKPNNGFTGTATVSAQVQGFGGSAGFTGGSHGGVSTQVTVSGTMTVAFTVNVGNGVNKINLSSSAAWVGTTFNVSTDTDSVNVLPPFSIAGPNNQVTIFTDQTVPIQVTVTYAGGFTGSVKVTPPSTGGHNNLQGIVNITPSFVNVTPGSPTATFFVTGDNSNVNRQNGSLTFTGDDGLGDTAQDGTNYQVQDPYSVNLSVPHGHFNSPFTATVSISPNLGFSGTVSVSMSASNSSHVTVTETPVSPSNMSMVSVSGSGATAVFSVSANNTNDFNLSTNVSWVGNAGTFTTGDQADNISAGISAASPASLTQGHQKMRVIARNDSCTGLRLSSASQSGCGGKDDAEVSPVIDAAGKLSVSFGAGQGFLDLGTMSMPSSVDPAMVANASWNNNGQFVQGHVYLVKEANGYAMVRVTRMRSTIDPRLGTVRGAGSAASSGSSSSRSTAVTTGASRGNGESGLLDDMHAAQEINRALSEAQVEIELELLAVGAGL
jgi:hypothetical protein